MKESKFIKYITIKGYAYPFSVYCTDTGQFMINCETLVGICLMNPSTNTNLFDRLVDAEKSLIKFVEKLVEYKNHID
tara:strand:+ start:1378 stop:1608 length:231 start_codon:yes stop_codon:yes gene_type:complete